MKLLPSFRYQIHDQRTAVLIFYGVLVGMILLNLLFLPFAGKDADLTVTSGGITAVTMVFSFILSLCAFKDSFLLNIQHGASRRSQFLARLGAMATVCGVMAVADEVYTLFIALLSLLFPNSFFAHSLYEICYASDLSAIDGSSFHYYSVHTSGSTILLSVVFSFFVLLAASALGYLITVLNYRLGKAGKIILWCSWPSLLIAGSALMEANPWLEKALLSALLSFSRLCLSTLPRLCLTSLVLAAVFSGLTWLLMRRMAVK